MEKHYSKGEMSSIEVPEMSRLTKSESSFNGSALMISRMPEISTVCFCVTNFSLLCGSRGAVFARISRLDFIYHRKKEDQ